jgi:indole-3-glycerol phosphate synthase
VSLNLARRIPAGLTKVSESGIRTGEDARRLADAGYDALLVGEALLRAPDAGGLLGELARGPGRPA